MISYFVYNVVRVNYLGGVVIGSGGNFKVYVLSVKYFGGLID